MDYETIKIEIDEEVNHQEEQILENNDLIKKMYTYWLLRFETA